VYLSMNRLRLISSRVCLIRSGHILYAFSVTNAGKSLGACYALLFLLGEYLSLLVHPPCCCLYLLFGQTLRTLLCFYSSLFLQPYLRWLIWIIHVTIYVFKLRLCVTCLCVVSD
jgi:hypothetical protein